MLTFIVYRTVNTKTHTHTYIYIYKVIQTNQLDATMIY